MAKIILQTSTRIFAKKVNSDKILVLNGMIAVDAITGEEYLKLTDKSKTDSEAWR